MSNHKRHLPARVTKAKEKNNSTTIEKFRGRHRDALHNKELIAHLMAINETGVC